VIHSNPNDLRTNSSRQHLRSSRPSLLLLAISVITSRPTSLSELSPSKALLFLLTLTCPNSLLMLYTPFFYWRQRLKRQHRRLFTSVPLFFRALQALCTSHHRLPIRRLVFDLFDVSLTPTVISTLLKLEHTLRKPRPPSSPRSSRLSFSSSSSDGDDEGGGEDDDDDGDGKGRDNAASVRVSAAVPARLKRRSLGKAAEATAGRGAGSSSDEVEEKPVPPLLLPPRRRIEGFG
jgi:hypothetical protein